MTTKLVCYGGHSKYMSDELNRTEAYTLSVVEHVPRVGNFRREV